MYKHHMHMFKSNNHTLCGLSLSPKLDSKSVSAFLTASDGHKSFGYLSWDVVDTSETSITCKECLGVWCLQKLNTGNIIYE